MVSSLDAKLGTMVQGVKERFGVNVRQFDRSRFTDEVRMFLDIYNSSLGGTWGFVPLSDGEVRHMAASLRHLIVPELALVAEVDGKPIGTAFCLLDYNPRIKAIDGRLFPFGFARLLWNKRGIKRMRAISTNVVPEYQAWGVGLVLMAGLVEPLLAWGMEEVEFSWVLESNHLSKRTLERGGATVTKKYRIYQDDPPRS
jgi:GNAT superfamily N-acetyltransferase